MSWRRPRLLGARTHIVEDYEADDIVGTLCHQLAGTDSHRTVVSSDKDLCQLVCRGRLAPGLREAATCTDPPRS